MVAAKQQSGRLGSGKVDRVVIIFKENHTFDNYFGTFPGANGLSMSRSPNPPPRDPDHGHSAWLTRQTNSVHQQFVEADIPAYFAYARKFTLCDLYFTDVAGPSTPNHLMVLAADSPFIDNPHPGGPSRISSSLPLLLDRSNLSWGNYGGYAFQYFCNGWGGKKITAYQFAKEGAEGKKPHLSWGFFTHPFLQQPPPSRRGALGGETTGMSGTAG